MRMVVVLPAPLGPRNPYTSPVSTFRSSPFKARVVPKFLMSPETTIAGGMRESWHRSRDARLNYLASRRVTGVSRTRGTRRIQEVTGGHEEDPARVLEEPCGQLRTREDTASRRFGTVRPRVQIPGPRPAFEFRDVTLTHADPESCVARPQGWAAESRPKRRAGESERGERKR